MKGKFINDLGRMERFPTDFRDETCDGKFVIEDLLEKITKIKSKIYEKLRNLPQRLYAGNYIMYSCIYVADMCKAMY